MLAMFAQVCGGAEDAHKPECLECASCIDDNTEPAVIAAESAADIYDGVAANEYGVDFDGAT